MAVDKNKALETALTQIEKQFGKSTSNHKELINGKIIIQMMK